MSEKIEKLDRIIDTGLEVNKEGISGVIKGAFVALAGVAIAPICPVAAPLVTSYGVGMMAGGAICSAGGTAAAAGAKIKKEIIS